MKTCICGGKKYETVKREIWTVDANGDTKPIGNKRVFYKCSKCGLIRQPNPPFANDTEYAEYYAEKYPPVSKEYQAKTYDHDYKVAGKRCDEYGIGVGCDDKILDVGSGSGAFVDLCREYGAQAYGCEVGKYGYSEHDQFIYKGRFEDIHFPTDHFDKVTCHDMLEHVLDPRKTVDELFRVTKQGGQCIIDIPNFFSDSGKHHWKEIEHLWFFSEEQLTKILEKAGFTVKEIRNPIPSKSVFYCSKPEQDRVSVLVPPGIGDSYWSIIKLQALIERDNLGIPDIYIACNKEKKNQGHRRAFPFIEMFPFLNSTGITYSTKQDPKHMAVWKEAYAYRGRTIFRNILDCDYFVSYNGHLRYGEAMEQIDPDLECNWYPPMFESIEQKRYKDMAIAKYGKYVLFYFVFRGTYEYWTRQFPIYEVVSMVKKVVKKTGCKPVFVGAQWDAEDPTLQEVKRQIPDHVDLVGKTTVQQLFGLIKGCQALVGYPSGLSIMSAVLKAKTLIIWNDYYDPDFAWFCCPPDTRGVNYFAVNTKDIDSDNVSDTVKNIIDGILPEVKLPKPGKARKSPRSGKVPKAIRKQTAYENTETIICDSPETIQLISKDSKVTVACVLKSGGSFTGEYVSKLKNAVNRHLTIKHDFVCFTDMDINIEGCQAIPLVDNLQGSWSKIELFRPDLIKSDRVIFFDLDTVILGNIDNIANMDVDFIGLKPWNKKNQLSGMFASGLMSWKNDGKFDFIYKDFNKSDISRYPIGDQEYISHALNSSDFKYMFYQDYVKGIYSYKRNCKNGKPNDARLVCFHGRPRPHEVRDKWVMSNWR